MISKSHIKLLIRLQKIAARKSIALRNVEITKTNSHEQYSLFKRVSDERKFLSSDFSDVKDIYDLINIVHNTRHNTITKINNFIKCKYCREVLSEMVAEAPEAMTEHKTVSNKDDELKPRFGNLITVLQQEVQNEFINIERRKIPSQNDLTRWTLKDAVLSFYQNLNIQDNVIVVDTLYDDRLTAQFVPDFNVIYKIWMEKLDELQRRDDKYALNREEYDKAEADLLDGMRGSNYEKQVDRYRESFMQKLKR